MNKNISKLSIALVFALIAGIFNSQAQKIGYVDLQEIMLAMPEYKKANTDMEAYSKSLEDEMGKLSVEFNKKYEDWQKNETSMTPTMKEFKQKELQEMQARLRDFQTTAQEDARKKEADLLKPIIEKAKNNIGTVAKENGYSYVLDTNTAGLLYKPEGDNLTSAVKKKLGISESAAPAKTVNPASPSPKTGGK